MPVQWKEAIILPIPKPMKDDEIINNYRPISKLPSLAKVFEKIESHKISKEIDELNVDFSNQFGFRSGRTTCHALYNVADDIAINLNVGTPTHLITLDCEKAYDTLWVHGFIYKMLEMGFSHYTCKFLLNYLSNRTYKVEINKSYSYSYTAQAGTPQGSVLSCLIYILYVVDFPKHNGSLNIKTSQFADDILIRTSTQITSLAEYELNNYLNKIIEYTCKWKIKINTNKCETIAIVGNLKQTTRKMRKDCKNISLILDNEHISKTTNIKYLGVFISKNFKFNFHLNYIKRKMIAAYFVLKPIFFNRKINEKVKLLAYKQIVKTIAVYACPIWLQVSRPQIENISTLERKILRSCCGLYRRPGSVKYYRNETLYQNCNIKPIQHVCMF